MQTDFTAADAASLVSDLAAIDLSGEQSATDTNYTITITGSINLTADLPAINLASGSTLTLIGGGNTLDGANTYRGIFAYAGGVTIEDLTIADATAKGGAGGDGFEGGGGAGLGGGLFVATNASVTLSNVTFSNDRAIGGAGGNVLLPSTGSGGGGGLGGAGGSGGTSFGGGGGGIGSAATGGNAYTPQEAGTGTVLGAAGGGRGDGTGFDGGLDGGGGGLGAFAGGGGGGVGGMPPVDYAGGGGGFGGGGGGQPNGGSGGRTGGPGGFGGGAGGGGQRLGYGGVGGWGGGGGGASVYSGGQFGGGYSIFGGGSGATATTTPDGSSGAAGGGGLGAGGDIFAMGSLTIRSGTLSGGGVAGGAAGAYGSGNATAGKAYTKGIFLYGDQQKATFAPGLGQSLTISDSIYDQKGAGNGSNTASVLDDGAGTLILSAANNYNGGTTIDAGTLELGNANSAGSGGITFQSSNTTLQLDSTTMPANTIFGFSFGNVIDLAGVQYEPGATASLNSSNNKLIVSVATGQYQLQLDPNQSFSGGYFKAIPDSGTGTQIEEISCFMPGTLIRTPNGDIAVETMRRGDLVILMDGGAAPIAWIGRQTVSTRFGDPLRVLPIRIKAGALGDEVPCRDLLVSPDHALLVDDVLIQAGALINGISILRERNVPERFAYYHLELDDHSLILAENTPAETFVDNADRLGFDNWGEHVMLFPDGNPIVELPHPRAKASRQVPRGIKQRLIDRGIELYSGRKVANGA